MHYCLNIRNEVVQHHEVLGDLMVLEVLTLPSRGGKL